MGVLLVDDNPEVQELVELTLQKVGLSVISVNDGLSALDVAISEIPDLILADFRVKGIDIATFIKKIQRRTTLTNIPIVLLLQGESDADAVARHLSGMHAVLRKPLDPILLAKAVKQQIGILEEEIAEKEEPADFPITGDFLSGEPAAFEEKMEPDIGSFNLLEPAETGTPPPEMEPLWTTDAPNASCPDMAPGLSEADVQPITGLKLTGQGAFSADSDSAKVDEAIRKIVLEVVERVAWEIIPGVVETAMPKGKIHSLVEQTVWEIVPPLAEIEIKKEIKRLQPAEGFSA